MKRTILTIGLALIIFGGAGYWAGYSIGYAAGNDMGWGKCVIYGNSTGYEEGYSLGYENGKEFVVTHLDQYVSVPIAVGYDEVVRFLQEDKTNSSEYSSDFDCVSYSRMVRENADRRGIRCAVVVFDLSGTKNISHAINAFETTDRGIVYFDPQTDGERFGIEVGGYYTLSERYKITKVDTIW